MSETLPPTPVELPTDQVLVLKVIPMPGDCNANGDIFGGWVMAQGGYGGVCAAGALYRRPHGDGCGERIYF